MHVCFATCSGLLWPGAGAAEGAPAKCGTDTALRAAVKSGTYFNSLSPLERFLGECIAMLC